MELGRWKVFLPATDSVTSMKLRKLEFVSGRVARKKLRPGEPSDA
jgi:hypothetical protein